MSDIVRQLVARLAAMEARLNSVEGRARLAWAHPVGGGGGVTNPNLVVLAAQAAHGFALGNAVKFDGVSWSKAVAGDDKVGIVCKVVDPDNVWVCEWGIVCIDGATYTPNSVYYLTATAGVTSVTEGTPKRAMFFAVSATMILVTNPAKDAAGGAGLEAITGPAVLGKFDAGSGTPAAISAGSDNTVLGRRGGSLTWAQIATAEIADDAVTADKLADTAVTPGSYGSATQVGVFTVDAQGRITAASNTTVTPAWSSITSTPTTLAGYGITDACSDAELAAHVAAADPHTVYRLESVNVPWAEISGIPSTFTPSAHAASHASGGGDQVDHNGLLNYSANRHIDHSTVSISPGTGLTGGGTIAANRTLTLANTTVTPGTYGSASSIPTLTIDAQGRITAASGNAVSSTLAGDVSGAIGTNTVDKIKGKSLDAAVGTVSGASRADLFMWWDKTTQTWAPFQMWNGSAVTGWVNCYDSTATDSSAKMTGVMAGTKRSVFCRQEATDGLPAALEATTVDTVLGYRGTTLTWAKVARAEQADGVGVSVIGRSVNTTGAVADIAAASDNFVLGRRAGVLTWAKVERAEQADGTGCSVIGRSANTTGGVADIAAGADDRVLIRRSSSLQWLQVTGSDIASNTVTRGNLANGTACTVIGRSANSTGSVADISAAANDTLLGRRGDALTFAKVARSEQADATAASVIGRATNSTGAVADITSAANQVLAANGSNSLAFSRTITLGDTSNAGSITIGNATSASAIVISPTLVTTAGKVLSIREIDVCDGTTAKKMLILASAPY
jgi:hypothetical protein